MECSCFKQGSLARKPYWWADSKLGSSRYSKRELNIIAFWIFFHRLAAETLVYSYWLIVCHLSMSGAYIWFLPYICKRTLINTVSKDDWKWFHNSNFNILMDISSCPWALQILSDLIILIMSLSSNRTEKSLSSVTKVWVSGILLLLSNGVQWGAKSNSNDLLSP